MLCYVAMATSMHGVPVGFESAGVQGVRVAVTRLGPCAVVCVQWLGHSAMCVCLGVCLFDVCVVWLCVLA